MSAYIVVVVAGTLVGQPAAAFYLVGQVVQSEGHDLVTVLATCASQSQAQAIVDSLNGTPQARA